MYEGMVARLQQLARRAGLQEVPPAVLVAAFLATATVVCWALWHWWPQPAAGETVYESGGGGGVAAAAGVSTPAAAPEATAPAPARVMVHVVGCVRHPGVYELAAESRVIDAVDAAGGTLPDAVLSAINMARVVADGEQILVPDQDDPAQTAPSVGGGGSSASAAGEPQATIDINSADAVALEALPGVGPSTAAKIVADREANGPFASVDDLGRVSGIGPKKLEGLKDAACVR